jgi:hypothetical protein
LAQGLERKEWANQLLALSKEVLVQELEMEELELVAEWDKDQLG